jgi:hypothetical protein
MGSEAEVQSMAEGEIVRSFGLLLQRQKDRVEESTSTLFDLGNTFASAILIHGAKSKVISETLILEKGLHNPRECVVSPKG